MPKTKPSLFKVGLIAVRPFALPASTMPVVFGSVSAAIVEGVKLNAFLFGLALLAMMLLHSGANLLSDVTDYKKGLDRVPTPASGAIVRGYIKPESGLIGSAILIGAGFGIGLFLVFHAGFELLIIGLTGVLIGVFYTLEPFALKYRALGDLAVFLDFGILGATGAWIVQTRAISWVPAAWAAPIAMLVVAILHANNWRDIQGDSKKRISTVASILGDRGSSVYYCFLVFGAFGAVLINILLGLVIPSLKPKMPLTFLSVFAAFPFALKLAKRGRMRKEPARYPEFIKLDAATSMLNLLFGSLATLSVILHWILERR